MRRSFAITIGSCQYNADVNADSREVELDKPCDSDHTGYMIEWDRMGDKNALLPESVNSGFSCSCGDFTHRHAATGSAGCKHIKAIAHDPRFLLLIEQSENARIQDEREAELAGKSDSDDLWYQWALSR